jgi:hypothetical protein
VRHLRELYVRGMAELEAQGKAYVQHLDSARHLRELYVRGMAELEERQRAEAEQKG